MGASSKDHRFVCSPDVLLAREEKLPYLTKLTLPLPSNPSDVYYRLSKIDGYRARSAYKLLHLDEQFGFFGQEDDFTLEKILRNELAKLDGVREFWAAGSEHDEHELKELDEEIEELSVTIEYAAKLSSSYSTSLQSKVRPTRAVDLCAAPGSWSQVLVKRLPTGSRIVAVDLQPMAPITGVHLITGDITTQETADVVSQALSGSTSNSDSREKAQLIICDGAPDVTGIHDVDEYLQAQLLLSALQITLRLLEEGGTFIGKIFCQKPPPTKGVAIYAYNSPIASSTAFQRSGDTSALLISQMRTLFKYVDVAKPRSSRIASHEHFIVCRHFQPPSQLVTPQALATPLHDLASSLIRDWKIKHLQSRDKGTCGVDQETLMARTVGLIAGGDLTAWTPPKGLTHGAAFAEPQ